MDNPEKQRYNILLLLFPKGMRAISVHEIFVLLNYISVFIMAVSSVIIATHSESRMQKLALLVSVSLTMCCLGFLFRSEAVDADSFIIGQKLVYTFVTHGMFLMLLFILEYCRFSIPKAVETFFHSVNFLISFAVLTLNHHPFFYKSYWAVPMDGYCVLEKEYGFLHTVAVGLFGLYMAAAVIITVVFSVRNIHKRRGYVWRILIAVMLPCVSYIIPKLTDSDNDLQPIAFAAFSLMMLYMIYRNNLYDVANIAKRFSIESMDEALIVFDDENHFQGCNRKAEELFPGLKTAQLDSSISEEVPVVAQLFAGNTADYKDNGKIYSVSVSPVKEGRTVQGRVLKLEDVTMEREYTDLLKASKEHLESEVVTLANYSYRDDLTGLYNRRAYEETVSEVRSAKSSENVIVGCADLNGLKEANDNIGHAAGDEIIKAAAGIMDSVFSKYGKTFRTGGDEFSVILTTLPESLDSLTEELERKAESWRGELVDGLSISYGFARGNAASVDGLLKEADREMYKFKRHYYEDRGIDRRGRSYEN